MWAPNTRDMLLHRGPGLRPRPALKFPLPVESRSCGPISVRCAGTETSLTTFPPKFWTRLGRSHCGETGVLAPHLR